MLIAISIYVLAQLAIAAWVARRTQSDTDYLLANRSLGVFAIAMSVFATWFGVEAVVTASGAVAGEGIAGALFDPIGVVIGLFIFAVFVAGPLRKGEHVMLSGFLGARFGPLTEYLSGLVVCASALIWASVQLLAIATLIASTGELSLMTALCASTALVLLYTLLGGLLGDIITDMVQGIILVVGLVLLFAVIVSVNGGLPETFSLIPIDRVTPPAPENRFLAAEFLLAPIAASIAGAELCARTLGARSPETARNGALLGAGLYLTAACLPVFFGLIAPAFGAAIGVELPTGDFFMPALAEAVLPPVLQVIFLGALLSAIFSTVDSALLAVSAVVTETVYKRIRPNPKTGEALNAARAGTIIGGLITFALAASGETIRGLAVQAASVGGCLLAPVVFGIATKQSAKASAPASILVGFGLLFWLEWVRETPGAFIFAMSGGFIAYCAIEGGARIVKR